MKRHVFLCAGWWPFIFLPLLLLLPLLFFQWHSIEKDIATNAHAKLQAAGLNWADVETFNLGRSVLVTGTAPSQADAVRAVEIAEQAEGVRNARFHTAQNNIAAPSAPRLKVSNTGGSMVLNGTVADQTTIDSLVAQATAQSGAEKVVNNIEIGQNTGALPELDVLFESLSGQPGVTASILDNELSLRGEVPSDKIKASLGTQLGTLFPGVLNNRLTVAAPPPIKRDVCQDLVNKLLANSKINFRSGGSEISNDSFALLNSIGDTAKQCPSAHFDVVGHTDSVGKLSFNLRLSELRAQAVVDYLIGLELSAERFSAIGRGPNQPVGDNDTAEGRAANRRIEFKLKN